MTESLITQHIDLWTSAIEAKSTAGRGNNNKFDLYGIKKLRELILELAMRGKLVHQDPEEQSAEIFIKNLLQKNSTFNFSLKCDSQNQLFPLPEGWVWINIGSICVVERGGSPRPIQSFLTEEVDGINWIKISDTDIGGKYIESTAEKIKKEGLNKSRMVFPGDFLLTNSMSFGRPYITKITGCIHDGWLRISPPEELDKDFLYYLLSSNIIKNSFRNAAAGAVVMNLNADKVRNVSIPIPPQAEQHRVVAKINELMTLCDQLEQQTLTSIDAHATLVETLLETLTNSADAAELEQNWARISEHFDTLFTTEQSIDALKQTILQLAVMGKLVRQDPTDEPASELLKYILMEKSRLIKENFYQKTSKLLEKDEIQLPNWWVSTQIGELCPSIVPNRDKPKSFSGDIPWVTLPSFPESNWYLDPSSVEFFLSNKEVKEYSARIIPANSVLMSCVGRFGLTAINPVPVSSNQQIHAFIIPDGLIPEYICMVIKAAGKKLADIASSTTIAYINKTKCESIQFGLPPFVEQRRIVDKVDQLMMLCEQLKNSIRLQKRDQLLLTDAIIEQVV